MTRMSKGASATPTGPLAEGGAAAASPAKPSVPSAGNNEPDWFAFAKAMAIAVMFQRGTRGVHTVGKDGRVRMGCVNLLGCYAVDDMARAFCEQAGIDFEILEPPSEQDAMFMLGAGMRFQDWLEKPATIRRQARGLSGLAEVDLPSLASAIEAQRAATEGRGAKHESATAKPGRPEDARK